ncbi:MAG: XRE family transcriptional regulator [Ruminococcaceae bacterium]|nr:XRE family transcriptional regulator [Oscillospiraceae bacterium]
MLDIKILGNRIKELRKQRGVTQNAFAEALHVSFQAVSNWERGIAPPELENLIHIAAYFGVLVDDLLRPQNDDLFLGIDGGGTKTEFVLVSADGYVQKRLVKSGCNPNDIGYSKMVSLILDGIGGVLKEYQSIKSIFCGIAGISTSDYAKRLYDELKKHYPQINIQIKNDSFNLFALEESADMAVISGTGSVVFVKDGNSYQRLGGWGYLLDTAGSAYDIGRDAIREALREEDMREKPSLMRAILCKKLNTSTVWEHIHIIYNEGKPYIAGLASTVLEAYRQGDEKAKQIIDRNARALAELLNAGVRLYGANPIAIASGGLFEHYGEILRSHIEKYSSVALLVNDLPPVYGACKQACLSVSCELSDKHSDNFRKTYGGKSQCV